MYPVLLRLYVGVQVVAAVGVAAEVAEPHVIASLGQMEGEGVAGPRHHLVGRYWVDIV